MIRTRAPIYPAAWGTIIVLLTVEVAIVTALRYFTGNIPPPPPIVANAFANPFLIIHIVAALTALVVAPLQFVRRVRTRWPAVHRVTGRIYVAGCAIGAPTGLLLALGTTMGPVAGSGFALLAILQAGFTWFGWRAAVARRFADHRAWMLRSYAMTASAITFRLMLPASAMAGLDFATGYSMAAWLCWTTNLALVEYYLRRSRRPARTYARLANA